MSFSVQRHRGDRRTPAGFSKSLLALADMIAEKDWERAVKLADGLAEDCRVEAILAGTVRRMES